MHSPNIEPCEIYTVQDTHVSTSREIVRKKQQILSHRMLRLLSGLVIREEKD